MIVKMIHFLPTGEITHTAEGNIEFTANEFTLGVGLREVNPKTEWFSNGEIVPRPQHEITIDKTSCNADGLDTVTISNAVGVLILDGVQHAITQPQITLTFEKAGDYRVTIKDFPRQDFEVLIHAN